METSICLRAFERGDAEQLAFHANNKKIADNLRNAFPYPYTLDDARAFIADCLQKGDERRLLRAIVVDGNVLSCITPALKCRTQEREMFCGCVVDYSAACVGARKVAAAAQDSKKAARISYI